MELARLEHEDIIELVEGLTPWVSPILVVPKPKSQDEVRICIDMRIPNRAIECTRHVMPTLELDEESRQITTFSTHVSIRGYKWLFFRIN